jgi:hypothetical protein
MSVPHGTSPARSARFSVRVPAPLKADVHALVGELRRDGLRTSQSELIEFFVVEGIAREQETGPSPPEPLAALDDRLRAWRAQQEAQA